MHALPSSFDPTSKLKTSPNYSINSLKLTKQSNLQPLLSLKLNCFLKLLLFFTMSTATESSSPAPSSSTEDIARDVLLWRRKKLSVAVLLVATAVWVVMEVYQFNFVTVASWASMLVVTSIFLWGYALRLLDKEPPNVSHGLEIAEQRAVEMAHSVRTRSEEKIRRMFGVGAEGDWFAFAGTLAALLVASKVGGYADLLTLLYIGIVLGTTLPVIYVKYEDKIKAFGERLKVRCKNLHNAIDERVIRKVKSRFGGQKKEKKTE